MASMTFLSLLLPSILLLLLTHIDQSLSNFMIKFSSESDPSYLPIIAPLLLVEVTFFFVFLLISRASGVATVLVCATSYADKNTSAQDLCARIRTSWRNLVKSIICRPMIAPHRLAVIAMALAVMLAVFYQNPITISVAIVVGVSISVYLMYYSVAQVMAHVVSVVEEREKEEQVAERAEELVKGQRHHGFMINLFFIMILGSWVVFGERIWSMNAMTCWLILLNTFYVLKIFGSVAYTVLYLKCKKFHGEEIIDPMPDLGYSKLPTSNLGADIP